MKSRIFFYITILLFVFSSSHLLAENSLVGVGKCKACHKKAKEGEQYKKWSERKHSKAFSSLASTESKLLAEKVGVSGDPQKAKECLVCHTPSKYNSQGDLTPEKMFGKKFKLEEGVQCENCHGAGGKYWKKKVMKKIAAEGGGLKSATAKETGLIVPDEKVCKQCHVAEVIIAGVTYKNPSFKDFDFESRVKEIAHPRPKK